MNSSWLGQVSGGFSNLTGQLTNFTKEVLTEGTEEVEDVEAELINSKRKVRDLESQLSFLRIELDRVSKFNVEYEEAALASKLRIDSLLKENENLLEELRDAHEERNHFTAGNETSSAMAAQPSVFSPTYLSQDGELKGCLDQDVMDLQVELKKAKSDVLYWKQMSEKIQIDSTLETQLVSEQEAHREELSALQNEHSESIRALLQEREQGEIPQPKDDFVDIDIDSADRASLSSESATSSVQTAIEQVSQNFDSSLKLNEKVRSLQIQVEKYEQEIKKLQQADKLSLSNDTSDNKHAPSTRQANSVESIERSVQVQAETTNTSQQTTEPTETLPGDEVSSLVEENINLRNELQQLTNTKEETDRRVKILEAENQQLHGTILGTPLFDSAGEDSRSSGESLENLERKLRETESVLSNKEEQFQEMVAERSQLSRQLDEVRISFDDQVSLTNQIKSRSNSLEDELASLRQELVKKCSHFAQLEQSIFTLTQENSNLRERASLTTQELSAEVYRLTDKLSQICDENESLSLAISQEIHDYGFAGHDEDVDEELNWLKEQLVKASVALNCLHHSQLQLQNDLDERTVDLDQLRRSLPNSELTAQSLNLDVDNLHERCQELDAACENYQSRIRMLEQNIRHFENELHEVSGEKLALERKVYELESDLESTVSANTSLLEKTESLVGEKLALEGEVTSTRNINAKITEELQSRSRECEGLQEQLSLCESDKLNLNSSVSSLRSQLQNVELRTREAEQSKISIEEKIAESTTHYESTIESLLHSNEIECNSRQSELAEVESERDLLKTKLAEVNTRKEQLEAELIDTKDLLASTVDGHNQTASLICEKEKEVQLLKDEISSLLLERHEEKEVVVNVRQELSTLKNQLEQLKSFADAKEADANRLQSELNSVQRPCEDHFTGEQTLGIITELETEIYTLKHELNKKNEEIEELEVQAESCLSDHSLQADMCTQTDATSDDVVFVPSRDIEEETLRQQLLEKDTIITEMQESNESLLRLFDSKSQKSYEKLAFDLHKTESNLNAAVQENTELKSVVAERDRELTYLKEESQQLCKNITNLQSILRAEEEKAFALEQKLEASMDATNIGMTQDAVKKLSALIRDKDTEIEALTQKNASLLQILQCSEDAGGAIEVSTLATERDNLLRDLNGLKQDRQNLIQLIHQKHDESIAYHGGLQKLNAQLLSETSLSKEKDKIIENLRSDCSALSSQQDDKMHEIAELSKSIHCKESELTHLKAKYSSDFIGVELFHSKCEELDLVTKKLSESQEVLKERDDRIGYLEKEFEKAKEENDRLVKELKELTSKTWEKPDAISDKPASWCLEQDRVLSEHSQGAVSVTDDSGAQQDMHTLIDEVSTLRNKNEKAQKELRRLKEHLLEIEEGYTKDALSAEDREVELRNRLAAAELKLASSSTAAQSSSKEILEQLTSLRQQIDEVSKKRDHAVAQLVEVQQQNAQYRTELHNLQMVLEHFQSDKSADENVVLDRLQRELGDSRKHSESLNQQLIITKGKLNDVTNALQAAQRLTAQLDYKDRLLEELKMTVNEREQQLNQLKAHLSSMASHAEEKVDKMLVRNLLIGYFHAPDSKKQEVIRLLVKILNFSQQEVEQLEEALSPSDTNNGWIPGFLRRSRRRTPSSQLHSPTSNNPNKSFAEAFVQFLQTESNPVMTPRLPVDQMLHPEHRPAFNPFSTAIPVSSALTPGLAQQHSPHLTSLRNPGAQPFAVPSVRQPLAAPFQTESSPAVTRQGVSAEPHLLSQAEHSLHPQSGLNSIISSVGRSSSSVVFTVGESQLPADGPTGTSAVSVQAV